jgi:hypothetical protein
VIQIRRKIVDFSKGDLVGIPVTYTRGAFQDELLVSFNVEGEAFSGFAKREDLKFIDDRQAKLKAEVLDVGDQITLKIFGSFFTTNGIEPFQSAWASANLNQMAAA